MWISCITDRLLNLRNFFTIFIQKVRFTRLRYNIVFLITFIVLTTLVTSIVLNHQGVSYAYIRPRILQTGFKGENTTGAKTCSKNMKYPPMLTSSNDGRLGNQMFSYAILIAASIYNHRTAFLSPVMSKSLSPYFKVTPTTLLKEIYECVPWKEHYLNTDFFKYGDSIRNITAPHVRFIGFHESWRYFDELRPIILQEFQFKDGVARDTNSRISNALKQFETTRYESIIVGIHVRRQDYVRKSQFLKIEIPTVEYYSGAMGYYEEKYSYVIFIVASDDLGWCMENFSRLKNSKGNNFKLYFLQGRSNRAGYDLAVLAKCDHVIFGIGTFGFWAAYLSGGDNIYCSDCILNKTVWIRDVGNYANFVLPNWRGYNREGKPSSAPLAKWLGEPS